VWLPISEDLPDEALVLTRCGFGEDTLPVPAWVVKQHIEEDLRTLGASRVTHWKLLKEKKMGIMDLATRFVVAVEKIADALNRPNIQIVAQSELSHDECCKRAEKIEEMVNETPEEMVNETPEELDRDAIKARLDELGITYNPKAATKTLSSALEKAEAAILKEKPAEDPFDMRSGEERRQKQEDLEDLFASEPAPVLTRDDVRAAMIAANARVNAKGGVGRDEVAKILQSAGGCARLGDLAEDKFGAVIEALKPLGV
jgi:hypothetical protein